MAQFIAPKKGYKGLTVEKIGRNEPCRCNSGKKAKNCCGTKGTYMSRQEITK